MIPAESLEAIRSKLDITELVAEYVPQMQRAGRHLKARCPFHQERTPSFIVNPERQTFHCFGCGEGGDAFAFLMKIENLSFAEAAEKLARRANVEIRADAALTPEEKQRLRLKELLAFAAEHYHERLLKAGDAEAARRYLASRHVSAGSLAAFQIGYAPHSGGLIEPALKKGFNRELLVKAGLAAERGGRLRDYFFDRILFPIRDGRGATLGFGARAMGEAEPKYLNSPDSPVFSKGRVLYGLFEGLSELRKARKAVLMEGYMDVIASHQHGFKLACAPLGTALTQEQAALVKRYAGEVVLVFDSDRAGLAAAVKGGETLLKAGLSVRVASMPGGEDPDEHLHRLGVQSLEGLLAKALDLADFKTEWLLEGQRKPFSPELKSKVAREVLSTIALCDDEILKGEWTRRLSQRLGVEESALRRQGDKTPAQPEKGPAASSGEMTLAHSDQQVLGLMFKRPELSALAQAEDLASEPGRRIWKALESLKPWGGNWSARLLSALGATDRKAASELLVLVEELDNHDPEAVLSGIIRRWRAMKRLKEIEPVIVKAGGDAEPAVKEEYHRLLSELKGTKRH
ncbi:MAG: DNA primase [Elusimicrobia bacterium]|nr:DNA primase [Elusimicrobiota bacterium]